MDQKNSSDKDLINAGPSASWVLQVVEDNRLPADIVAFVKEHQNSLEQIGQDTFKNFLYLVDRGQKQQAIESLIAAADFKVLTGIMEEIADAQEKRNLLKQEWEQLGWQFIQAVAPAVIKILITVVETVLI